MARQGSQERTSSSCCKTDKEDKAETDGATAVNRPLDVVFGSVDKNNAQRLRELNLQLFPVQYNLAFYKEVVSSPPGYAQLGRTTKLLGGVMLTICCRREPVKEGPVGLERTYIMTLGCWKAIAGLESVGSRLLEGVIAQSIHDGVVQVYLHVQTSNTAALRFYRSLGFEATQILRNYYKRIDPPDCYVLRRQLTP
ncbi:Acyl-CoA N-acyltransferase [Phytophthora cactorum]|nr:Acyl-CoA N-acyltransferase [Phytophthora cactorum]